MTVVFSGSPPSEAVKLLRDGVVVFMATGSTSKLREVEQRIAELERREALLTEIVRILDREKQIGGVSHHYGNLLERYRKTRASLDWLPPEPEFVGHAKVSGWPVDAGFPWSDAQ